MRSIALTLATTLSVAILATVATPTNAIASRPLAQADPPSPKSDESIEIVLRVSDDAARHERHLVSKLRRLRAEIRRSGWVDVARERSEDDATRSENKAAASIDLSGAHGRAELCIRARDPRASRHCELLAVVATEEVWVAVVTETLRARLIEAGWIDEASSVDGQPSPSTSSPPSPSSPTAMSTVADPHIADPHSADPHSADARRVIAPQVEVARLQKSVASRGWRLRGGMGFGFGDHRPSADLQVGVVGPWFESLSVEAFLRAPIVAARISGEAGAASIQSRLLGLAIARSLSPESAPIRLEAGVGVALAWLRLEGQAAAPRTSATEDLVSVPIFGRLAVDLPLSSAIALRAEGMAGLSLPKTVVVFAGQRVGDWGWPWVATTLSLQIEI